MASSRKTSTVEILLQILEATSLGAVSAEQVSKQVRRAHPFGRLSHRVEGGLSTLEAEGLIESGADDGQVLYRTTPSGLATLEAKGRFPGAAAVLFTDIVGSTEMIAELGEAGAHESRQRHFALLRKAVAANDGREVKSLGDGLMVVFANVFAAAKCADMMQRAVARDSDRLGLRAGVHSGELLREGNDYFGSTVIIARRLCDGAAAGETIISTEAADLIEAGAEGRLEPLGPVDLKGISSPVNASRLLWAQSLLGVTR